MHSGTVLSHAASVGCTARTREDPTSHSEPHSDLDTMHRPPARSPLTPLLIGGGALGALLLHAAALSGQLRDGPGGEPPLELPRIEGPIEIDGIIDEAAWAGAAVLEGIVAVPDFGAEPSQRGDFLLAHNGEYLYLGCLMYESDPDLVRITTLERDVSPYQTDSCGMRLDSYNDEENSLVFITNTRQCPHGLDVRQRR